MPVLLSKATGNLTASGSWALVDTTSFLDSKAGNTALNTVYSSGRSSTFTPGAITIDAIAIQLASRAASPSGTISIGLYNDTDTADVAGTEVTIDIADLPTCDTTQDEGGWIVFKLASPVLLVAGKAYRVQGKTSVAAQVNLYRDATATNWARMLRTTTAQAPVAGDTMHVAGEHTGSGIGSNYTITMNETATTDYGPGVDGQVALDVNKRSSLIWGTVAATNYYLKLSGNLHVNNGGTFTRGSIVTPIPRDSTAILEFDPVADGGMGFIAKNGATVVEQGLSRTVSKNVVRTQLTADAAAAATTLNVGHDTGWLTGDEIAITKTVRSASEQTEERTLNANAGASSMVVTAGLTSTHIGTAPVQAHVALLTRNVKTRSADSAKAIFYNVKPTANVDVDWVEFRYLGFNTTGKRGIEIETTTGLSSFENCSIRNSRNQAFYLAGAAFNNITFSNNIIKSYGNNGNAIEGFTIGATTGSAVAVSNNLIMSYTANGGNGLGGGVRDIGITFTGNIIIGSTNGALLGISTAGEIYTGNFDNNEVSFSGSNGIIFFDGAMTNAIFNNWVGLRNNGGFILFNGQINNGAYRYWSGGKFKNWVAIGNSGDISFTGMTSNLIFEGWTGNADSISAQTSVVGFGNLTTVNNIKFINCDFGTVSGIKTASTNLVGLGGALCNIDKMLFQNCKINVTTVVANPTNMSDNSSINIHKFNQVANDFRTYQAMGLTQSEVSIRDTASGYSWKNTPTTASKKLAFPGNAPDTFVAPVYANLPVTITARVLYNAAYNGAMPRLIIAGGVLSGVPSDVINTAPAAAPDVWQTLTATVTPTEDGVLEYLVDGDGTAGSYYVDNVIPTQ